MKTALESASVAQLLGEDSDVSNGADEDYDCANQDGLSGKRSVGCSIDTVTSWREARIL